MKERNLLRDFQLEQDGWQVAVLFYEDGGVVVQVESENLRITKEIPINVFFDLLLGLAVNLPGDYLPALVEELTSSEVFS